MTSLPRFDTATQRNSFDVKSRPTSTFLDGALLAIVPSINGNIHQDPPFAEVVPTGADSICYTPPASAVYLTYRQ
jgi:hypothetical protein